MDLASLLQFQELLLNAAEGARGEDAEAEYRELRRRLLADANYKETIPTFVRRHRDLASLWPTFKSFSPQWEPRRVEIRNQFDEPLRIAEGIEDAKDASTINSSAWTGAKSPAERAIAIRTMFPVAIAAVDRLIELLEKPGHNGGPPLNGTEEAIKQLRALHEALGELLIAADEGRLNDAFGGGLPVAIATYAKRAAKNLRDDPFPYAFAATILGILNACGIPSIGGFLAGVAVNMKRK